MVMVGDVFVLHASFGDILGPFWSLCFLYFNDILFVSECQRAANTLSRRQIHTRFAPAVRRSGLFLSVHQFPLANIV